MTTSKSSKPDTEIIIDNVNAHNSNSDNTNADVVEKPVNYPTAEWQKFGEHNWSPSDLSKDLHQAMILVMVLSYALKRVVTLITRHY